MTFFQRANSDGRFDWKFLLFYVYINYHEDIPTVEVHENVSKRHCNASCQISFRFNIFLRFCSYVKRDVNEVDRHVSVGFFDFVVRAALVYVQCAHRLSSSCETQKVMV